MALHMGCLWQSAQLDLRLRNIPIISMTSTNRNTTALNTTRPLPDHILGRPAPNRTDLALQDNLRLVERARFADLQNGGTIMMTFARWRNTLSTLESVEIALTRICSLLILLVDIAIIEECIEITVIELIKTNATQALLLSRNLRNAEEVPVIDIVLDWKEDQVIAEVTRRMESSNWIVG